MEQIHGNLISKEASERLIVETAPSVGQRFDEYYSTADQHWHNGYWLPQHCDFGQVGEAEIGDMTLVPHAQQGDVAGQHHATHAGHGQRQHMVEHCLLVRGADAKCGLLDGRRHRIEGGTGSNDYGGKNQESQHHSIGREGFNSRVSFLFFGMRSARSIVRIIRRHNESHGIVCSLTLT